MYKNRVKKFPLFHPVNEEIKSGKIQNNIYILNFPAQFSAGFSHSQDKRAGISKYFLSFSTLFIYIPWKYLVEKIFTCVIMQDYANCQ